jgi:hypothetical protein
MQLRLTTRRELEAARLQHQQERDTLVEAHTAVKLKVGDGGSWRGRLQEVLCLRVMVM